MKLKSIAIFSMLFLNGCTASLYMGTDCKADDPWSHLADGPRDKNELLDQITALPESGHFLGKHLEWYEGDNDQVMACFHAGDSCDSSRVYFTDRKLKEVEQDTECQ
jgi:hypothetical protein